MNKEELNKLAKLARVNLTDDELDRYTPQMKTILESAKVLNDIDTSNSPVYSPHTTKLTQLREDVSKPGLTQDQVLSNAPFTQDRMVKVFGRLSETVDA